MGSWDCHLKELSVGVDMRPAPNQFLYCLTLRGTSATSPTDGDHGASISPLPVANDP